MYLTHCSFQPKINHSLRGGRGGIYSSMHSHLIPSEKASYVMPHSIDIDNSSSQHFTTFRRRSVQEFVED
jgi:protein-disulfide isomerase-like protein with CxxC motif